MTGTRRCVFLDRDGTVIVNKHYQKDPNDTELLPNAREGLALLRSAGYDLVLVTNQSGIGRGYFTRQEMEAVNKRVSAELSGGNWFTAVYHCPHVDSDDCPCRKPRPGMLRQAAADLDIDLGASYMVGDREVDIMAGQAAGVSTVLVRTGGGRETESEGTVRPDYVADDLLDAANWILSGEKPALSRE